MKNTILYLILFSVLPLTAQINYSCDMESCGSVWDNNGFADNSSYTGGCSGDGINENVYGSGSYSKGVAYNYSAITGHTGGELTVSVKAKLRDYYSSYADRSGSEWGTLKIYYKTTRPSHSSPGTQIGSDITSSTDCQTHTVSFTPGSTISNLYIAFEYSIGSGDNWIIFDDVTVVESTGPSISASGSLSTFSACAGSNSSEQSFTIAGSNLEADILVSAPTGYEISTTSGSGFGSSLTLAQSGGTVNSTTTYVRLKDDASNSASGNIALTSTNATTVNVATGSATVNAASTYYVDDAGSNSNSGTSSGSPWLTLAHAISQAGQCATINIAAGTYTDDLLDVTSSHNGITIAGAGISSTIFDQSGSGDHFMEIKSSATDITLKNLKIMDYDENNHGGAIDITSGTVTIENVHFHNNSTTSSSDDGGAIYAGSGTNVSLSKCIFTENESYNNSYSNGSCIYSEATLILTNCLFYDNVCNNTTYAAHVYVGENSATFYNCTFTENGGGEPIRFYGNSSTGFLRNCLFYNNSSSYDVKEEYSTTTKPEMDNCYYEARTGDFNTGSESSNLTSGTVGFIDAANNDFRINSTSVCKNAGTSSGAPSTDINGDNRDDGTIDIGCYEYSCSSPNAGTAASSSTVCPGATVSLTSSGTSSGPIKWQQSSDNSSWTDVSTGSGYTTGSFTSAALTSTTYYRVAASCDGSNYSATSSSVTATISSGTLYVDDGGSNSNSGTASNSPFLTLSHAISQATCGYTINVAAGTYTDDKLDVTSTHDGLTIAGAGISSTIFDQSGSGDHFMEIKSSATNITLKDLKIMDYDENNNGGAIDITSGTVTIENVHFHNNSTTSSSDDGGAIYASSGTVSLSISKCIFTENESYNYSSSDGSCIYSEASTFTLTNSLFYDNVCGSTSSNGHVYIDDGTATITNCTFTENGNGNVFYLYDDGGTPTTFINCLFYNNTSTYDVYEQYQSSPYPEMDNCYYENRYGSYKTGSESGNLTSGTVGFTDATNNDFSITSTSACVDAGTDSGAPSDDLNGNSRSSTDIGCYEFALPEWTGGAGTTDWNTSGNWASGSVPGSSSDIIIPSTSTDPVITGAVSARSFTIQSGGELTVSGSGSLALSGDVTISGTMNYTSSGSITLSKNGGTLSGTGTQTGADYVLSNGASFDLSDSWSIDNMNVNSGAVLTVATTKTLTTGTNLTNGGTLTCSGSAGLTVGGNVSLSGTTVMNSGTLDTDGDFGNSGTFTAGTSTLKLSGSSSQSITNTNMAATIPSATASTDAISETFESGLGGFATSGTVSFATTSSYQKNGSKSIWNDYTTYNTNYLTYSSNIDLSNHTDANLTFWHISALENGYDYAFVQYSQDGGSNWTTFPTSKYTGAAGGYSGSTTKFDEGDYSGWTSVDNNDWKQETFDMDFLCGQNDIRIRFYMTSDVSGQESGWYIDDIIINGTANNSNGGAIALGNEFYNVVIDNSSGGVDLSTADIGYSNSLTMTNGIITTGTDDTVYIESTSASAMPTGSSTSFINGIIKFNIAENTDTYTIPLGDGTASSDYYRVDFVNNNLQGVKYITARVVSGLPDGYDASALAACNDSSTQAGITAFKLKELSSESYLKLTPNSQPTGGSYGLKIYTENYAKSTWTNNKVAIFKRSEGTTDNCAWSIAGTLPADNATGRLKTDSYLSFTGATSFSVIVPGGQGGGGLPVSLSAFDALLNDEGKVDISWTTMSEQDNDFFSVQRTADGGSFEEVEEVPGAGNSIVRIDYSVTDEEPLFGTSYYRLMQQDYDGMQTYSDMVAVNNNFTANLTSFSLFYEGNQTINLRHTLGGEAQYNVSVYDISGKIIYSDVLNLGAGTDNTQLNITDLSRGLYFVNLSSGQELYSQKIVVH